LKFSDNLWIKEDGMKEETINILSEIL